MPSVLITTDFSNVSRHSLDYACTLLQGKDVTIDLLHVYSIPVSYTADGVAVSAISYGLDFSAERMEEEVAYVQSTYPSLKIAGRVITGNLVECLQDETRMRKPMFVVLGTAGFADFAIGEDDPLNALRSVSVPVLFIPFGTAIKPISRVAYACDYAGI